MSFRPNLGRSVIPPVLFDPDERERLGLGREGERGDYVIELNLLHAGGPERAAAALESLLRKQLPRGRSRWQRIARTYYRCSLRFAEVEALVSSDDAAAGSVQPNARHRVRHAGSVPLEPDPRRRAIYKVWPDFQVRALIDRSVATVKADAAFRAYEASGEGIVWAVLDSGVDARHPHFGTTGEPESHTLLDPAVVELHRDFTVSHGEDTGASVSAALTDESGHGTHVAGIIAGGLRPDHDGSRVAVFEHAYTASPGHSGAANRATAASSGTDAAAPVDTSEPSARRRLVRQRRVRVHAMRGVAPACRIVSLKVLDANGHGRTSDIIRALQYLHEEVNGDPRLLRVHGVNLSVGYEFDAEMFACGQSPLCVEVNRLVRSGVVVVVAAGNTGYARLDAIPRLTKVGLSSTINDPGNAELAITVGSTHGDSPHTYGVSYFSSKGPTGDGRLKPDLVAPGERITSCAAGRMREALPTLARGTAAYIDDSGTSLAAPHVSGAIAAFLSIRREFILRPDEVKRIFLSSATPLGRERYFEGHGLVDLMRAIQSV
jgi:serine protease AprX